mmetsp:Transcript_39904/g.103288  ORF Transcript_39904/g.103288 Transcript_39904/m.103288 type:complete len:193 (+) Transcript_39904:145-723(+)
MAASGVAAAVLLLLLLVGGPGQAASAPVCEDGKQTEYRARIMLSLMPGGDTDYSYLLTELIPNATALSPADVEVSSYESVTVNTNDVGKQRLYANNGGNKNRLRALGFRKLLGAITGAGVDECEDDVDTAVRMQLKLASANETALLAFKEYVEAGRFVEEIVAGAACGAELKGRAFANNGVEIQTRKVRCTN